MKIAVHLLLCILVLGLVGASSCKREKPKDPLTLHYTLGEVADYMVFQPGTYWIYQNDVTGDIDSQWVTGTGVGEYSQKGTEEYSKHITLKQEYFEIYIASNFVDGLGEKPRYKVYSWGNKVNAFPGPYRAYQVERDKTAPTTGGSSVVYHHSYKSCPKRNCYYYYDTLLVNYKLNNSVYDTVRVFRVNQDFAFPESKIPSQGSGKSDYYIAKHVGIIKIYNTGHRLADGAPLNQAWSLIRKKIVQ